MPTSSAVLELNRALARKINEKARDSPGAPFAGKFVDITNGQVVAVADDLDELVQRLHQVEADLCQTLLRKLDWIMTRFRRSGASIDVPGPVAATPPSAEGASGSSRQIERHL